MAMDGQVPGRAGMPTGYDRPMAMDGQVPGRAGMPTGYDRPMAMDGQVPGRAGMPTGCDAPAFFYLFRATFRFFVTPAAFTALR